MSMMEKWSREFIRQCNPLTPDTLLVPREEWLQLRAEIEEVVKSYGDILACCEECPFENFMFMGIPTVPV